MDRDKKLPSLHTRCVTWWGTFGTTTLAIRPMTRILSAPRMVSKNKYDVPGIKYLSTHVIPAQAGIQKSNQGFALQSGVADRLVSIS